ncbi:MAG: hypothetical protein R2710_30460 [Acidimicrobiales bacterium]
MARRCNVNITAAMFGFAAVFYEASMPAIAFLTVAIPGSSNAAFATVWWP